MRCLLPTVAQRRSRFFSENEGAEDMCAQTPGIGVADMVDPALDAGVELGETELAALPGGVAPIQPARCRNDLARLDPAVSRENDEAGKRRSQATEFPAPPVAPARCLRGTAAAAPPGARVRQPSIARASAWLVVGEEREVVHVAHVPSAAKFVAHEQIQGVQEDVRPELRAQVAELGRLLGGWIRQDGERRSTPG